MSDTTHQEFSHQNLLSFALYNFHMREDRNLLYINDNPDELRFNLEIKNSFSETIKLSHTQSKPEAPSGNNYHIELKFRPNQLSPRSREKIDLSEDSKEGWSMSRPYENRDRTVSLFLLKRKDELVIEQQGTKLITLVGLGANSIEGARVTQLEINYKDFYFAQEKSDENADTQRRTIDSQTQIIILTVLNYSGKREANLTVTFAYAPTLLNNGSDSEPIVLQIVNTGQDSITLNENSKFELTIDVEGERAEPWALAKKDEAKTYDVDIEKKLGNFLQSRESWIIEKPIESREDPTWVIRPNFGLNQRKEERDTSKDFTFKQNEDFFIKIINLKSSLRPGIGNLYLAYYNLPGYMDRKTTLNVTKTCITERKGGKDADGRIGINKYPDSKTQLDVKGKIASDSLEVKGDAVANSLTVKDYVCVEGSLTVQNKLTTNSIEIKKEVEGSLTVQNKLTTNSIEIKKEVEGSLTVQNKLTTNSIEIKKEVEGSLTVQENIKAQSFSGLGALTFGMIIIWVDNDFQTMNGPSIPDGYALCNGRHGTPDLRKEFKNCGGNKALFYLMKIDKVISEVVLDPIFGQICFSENKEWKTKSGYKLRFFKEQGNRLGKLELADKNGTTSTIFQGVQKPYTYKIGGVFDQEASSAYFAIQSDGNFCIYCENNIQFFNCVWTSNTQGIANFLVLEDDGKIGGFSSNGMRYLQ